MRERLGAELSLVATNRHPFNDTIELVAESRGAGGKFDVTVGSASESLRLSEADCVWLRRVRPADPREHGVPGTYAEAVRKQSRDAILGVLSTFAGPVVDPYECVHRASHKPLQLKRAIAAGLDVPRTIVSNDPRAVRRLVAEAPNGVVAKTLTTLDVVKDGERWGMFTTLLSPEHLDDIDSVHACPMIFQERVERSLEVRATVIGDRVYAAAISDREIGVDVDWRRVDTRDQWAPYELPDDVVASLLALVHGLGLTYSAADFIVTPRGEHFFLESNPGGEWLWVDDVPGIDLTGALADHLIETARLGSDSQPMRMSSRR